MDGLITVQSNFTVKNTTNKMVSLIQIKGFTIFGRINHAAEAE